MGRLLSGGNGGGGGSQGSFSSLSFRVGGEKFRLLMHMVILPNVKTLSGGEFGWGGTSVKR